MASATWAFLVLAVLCRVRDSLEIVEVSGEQVRCPEQCSCSGFSSITIYCGFYADENFQALRHVPKNIPIQTTFLSLHRNNIERISEKSFQNLTSLKNLNLRDNQLVALPERAFRDLIMLKSLNLGANKLSYLPDNVFEGLESLEELFLNGNRLSVIPERLFHGLTSLRRLYLHKNALHVIPERVLHGTINMQGLWLNNNMLNRIEKDTFRNLTNLEILYMGNNNLTSLDRNILNNIKSLKILFINDNNLNTLPQGIFNSLPQEAGVSLYNNPFVCDCKLHWFKTWIVSMRFIYFRNKIRCLRPTELAGRSIVTIKYGQFTCSEGQWSSWSIWSPCSETCGHGRRIAVRTCVTTVEGKGRAECPGDNLRWESCSERPCVIHGGWTQWSTWTGCSVTCSTGFQQRFRNCTFPVPRFGGSNCNGLAYERKECKHPDCPVTEIWTAWSMWSTWSQCSATCAVGKRVRTRLCLDINKCSGNDTQVSLCYLGFCPINGGWSSWSSWTTCSASCSNGTKSRTRTCSNPSPQYGGLQCKGNSNESSVCMLTSCPVNGSWSSWSSWTTCSASCSNGTKSRTRTCSNPSPQYGGLQCQGNSNESSVCILKFCPVNGGWSSWSSWTTCSASCSNGTKSRKRTCSNPSPQYGGLQCQGNSNESSVCILKSCPVNGGWSSWSSWTMCSASCSNGTKSRTRTCSNPSPQYGGLQCEGNSNESSMCILKSCAVNGGWSSWSSWTTCSASCSNGTKSRTRTCSNPSPQYGGLQCQGNSNESSVCMLKSCPVNGGWSSWSSWTTCSASCSNGTKSRTRTCSDPSPQYGGLQCQGNSNESSMCILKSCPVNGGWSSWSSWTTCSASCSNGTKSRTRTCSNPSPQYGGLQCQGNSNESSVCMLKSCPVNGGWSSWSSWTTCSASCSNGTKSRTRTCSNPSPQYGGLQCQGNSNESSVCILKSCPVNGGWSSWSLWSACSKTCSHGYRIRNRTCNNPSPSYGGRNCPGVSFLKESCFNGSCPHWSEWSNWTSCNVSCGNGSQTRTRICLVGNETHQDCLGLSKEMRPCVTSPCPIDGGWSQWSAWLPCSKSCSNGTKTRRRNCTNPFPQNGGKNCSGKAQVSETCVVALCEGIWSEWSPWSQCSSSCSTGTRHRYRKCTTKDLPYINCKGNSSEVKLCDHGNCPIDGAWSDWGAWTPCSTTCSIGTKSRARTCASPKPMFGGKECQGASTESTVCISKHCDVEARWSTWSKWSECSASCNQGVRVRTRNCTQLDNVINSSSCIGNSSQITICNVTLCTVNTASWTPWSAWTSCSLTCGLGRQVRSRNCSTSLSGDSSNHCKEADKEVRICYAMACVKPQGWSSWSNWTSCTRTCGYGIQVMSRVCNNPSKNNACEGQRLMIRSCQIISCDILRSDRISWLPWTHWTKCSASCGRGHQMRWRFCYAPGSNDSRCSSEAPFEVHSRICTIKPCNYSSVWTTWTKWEGCTNPCHDGGVRKRVRYCLSRAVGIKCKGKGVDVRPCNISLCQIPQPSATHPPLVELGSPIPCPDPGTPRNGQRKFIDQIPYGSYYVTYSCNKHFAINGPRLRHCEDNNKWSDMLPECRPICGKSSNAFAHRRLRIVGGGPTMPGAWPWQVALEFDTFQPEFNSFHCGGTLIAENWVVTAAHCVVYKDSQIPYHGVRIYVGVHDITKRHWDQNVQIIPSAQIISNPKFNWKTYDSDIALIRLRWRVNITDFVRPVCLPNGHQRRLMKSGTKGAMLGWGVTETRKPATKLREVFIPIVDHKACKKAYENETWPVTSNMLCAGFNTQSKDSCNRDSGGGFILFDQRARKRRWFLGGIISWGNPKCGIPGKYSVFTRITHAFVKWMRHQMNKFGSND